MTEIDKPIRRLNIKVSLALLSLFLKLSCAVSVGGEFRLYFGPSVCSVALCSGVRLLCTRLAAQFSVVYSVLNVCAGDIYLLFKLLLKFRNVLKHSEGRSCFSSSIFKYQRRRPH